MSESQVTGVQLTSGEGAQRIRPLCQKVLDEFAAITEGVRVAVLASSDGFPLAAINLQAVEGRRLTAMGATLSSLCARMAQDLTMGDPETMTIDSGTGVILCRQLPNRLAPMVLVVVTDGSINTGYINWAVKKFAGELAESLNALVFSA